MAGPLNGIGGQQQIPLATPFQPGQNGSQVRPQDNREPKPNQVQQPSSQLGQGAVSGLNLSNLDITTSSGAADALKVIDQAIADVSKSRGNIGNFMRNVLESNVRSLGVAKENLAATESQIRDVDIAEEMTSYTKLQILQQSGLSVLAQANSSPQSVLSLLR